MRDIPYHVEPLEKFFKYNNEQQLNGCEKGTKIVCEDNEDTSPFKRSTVL